MSAATRVDLRVDGLLWMINTTVFHPRGFALGVDKDGDLWLFGDGAEAWQFATDDDLAQVAFQAFNATLQRQRVEAREAEQ